MFEKGKEASGRAHPNEETHMTFASHSPLAISSERCALERRTDSDSDVIEGKKNAGDESLGLRVT